MASAKTATLTFRIEPGLKEAVRTAAVNEHRSIANMIAVMIRANQLIDRTTATRNPFDAKYSKVEGADWETCAAVLNGMSMKELLSRGW